MSRQRASSGAEHDPATGLPGRAAFLERASGEMERAAENTTMNMLTLKVVNGEEIVRQHGEAAYAVMRQEVARRLQKSALHAGAVGDDSFAALIPMAEALGLIESADDPVLVGGERIRPSLCWGASRYPEHGREAGDLLGKAEVALSTCQARGRNWFVYDASLEPDSSDLQLVRDFEAFGRNEVFAVYQPQLDLKTGRIVAAEALVRWDHPEHGIVPPDRFIPLIENAGLVSAVTAKMIDAAVRESVRFRTLGLRCRFGVNLSAHDFHEADIVAIVTEALEAHGGQPEDIIVELTESRAVDSLERAREVLGQLKAMGLGIAIDDFGTGFSSLASLAQLPFDELKIDQLFVREMLTSPSHRSIVDATITMAHRLGLTVVAEGVEHEALIIALQDSHCDRVQGVAIEGAVAADALLDLAQRFSWERPGT